MTTTVTSDIVGTYTGADADRSSDVGTYVSLDAASTRVRPRAEGHYVSTSSLQGAEARTGRYTDTSSGSGNAPSKVIPIGARLVQAA